MVIVVIGGYWGHGYLCDVYKRLPSTVTTKLDGMLPGNLQPLY